MSDEKSPWDELVRRVAALEEEVQQLKRNTTPEKRDLGKEVPVSGVPYRAPYSELLRESMKK